MKNSKDALGAAGKKDAFLFDPENLHLVTDPKHPIYDERVELPIDEALTRNIMHHGVVEPVIVQKNPETGETQVVDGRQRVKACREANKRLLAQGLEPHRVLAVVRRGDAAATMGVLISANEFRHEDSPMGRAKKIARYLELGRTEEEAGILMGISASSVKNLVALLDAPEVVRKAVESNLITASDGYKLAKLSPEDASVKIEELKLLAPRTPGKKRSENAQKAREIVDGKPRMRSRKDIESMIGSVGDFNPSITSALRWVLGGDLLEVKEGVVMVAIPIESQPMTCEVTSHGADASEAPEHVVEMEEEGLGTEAAQ